MRRDRLQEHTNEFHTGQPKMEAGGRSHNIMDMFARRPSTSSGSGSSGDKDAAKKRKMEDASDSEDCEETRDLDTPSPTEQVDQEISEERNAASVRDTSDTLSASVNNMEAKLDNVLNALGNLKLSLGPKQTHEQPKKGVESEMEALKILIQNSKCIRRVCDLVDMTASDEFLRCDVCCPNVTSDEIPIKNGVFRYDFTLGTDFTAGTQPQAFRNLKKNIARHMDTQAHIKNLMMKEEVSEELRKRNSVEQSVGLTVGKQAYRLLKYGRPFSDFEVDMALLSSAKVNVGNLNHSRKFPSQLRPAFADAVNSRIKSYLKEPLEATLNIPPIGIVADKVTTRRRTSQMYAGIIFTPTMPSLLTPISLGMRPVKGHNGESIAADIVDLCKIYDVNNSQIAGFGFDGQYFHLHVDSILKDKLDLNDKVGFSWDPAHKLQLADKDTRKDEGLDWIDGICSDIAAVLGKFAFGKTFEKALEKAHELGIDMKAPLWFSDTRFAAFAHLVFKNFMDNYTIIRRVLEEIAESDTSRAKDACDLLRRIRKFDFVAKALILIDFYKHLGAVSRDLQRVDHPVWLKASTLSAYITALEEMQTYGMQNHRSIMKHFVAIKLN